MSAWAADAAPPQARRRCGELALELEDQTVGRFLADAWHAGEKRGVALLDGVCEILSAHA